METGLSVATALWSIAGLVCHQLPDRTPHFEGAAFPLCFRCTGLYLSVMTTFLYLALNRGWRRGLPDTRCAISISLLIVPLFIDGWANLIGLWSSPGWVRALTGIGVGLVLPLFLVPLARGGGESTSDVTRPIVSSPLALLPPAITSVVLLWLVIHPVRLLIFQTLAVAASSAPIMFAATFALAGWRTRVTLSRALGISPRKVPCSLRTGVR